MITRFFILHKNRVRAFFARVSGVAVAECVAHFATVPEPFACASVAVKFMSQRAKINNGTHRNYGARMMLFYSLLLVRALVFSLVRRPPVARCSNA